MQPKPYSPTESLSTDTIQAILLEIMRDNPALFFSVAELLEADKLNAVQSVLQQVAALRSQGTHAALLPSLLPKMVADIRARRQAVQEHGSAAVGFSTKIKKLDKILGGLQTGIHILAAEPGQGKTTFALQICSTVAHDDGVPVLFISFEEPLWKLALKVICLRAGLVSKKFQDGYGNPDELQKAVTDFGQDYTSLMLVEGNSKLTVSALKVLAEKAMEPLPLRKCLIIVDYAQRWAGARRDFTEFRHTVNALVGELRDLALQIDSPILLISSQNRTGQGKAEMTSLKESGDLEYTADSILFLVESEKRKALPPARAVDLMIRKNRYGETGKIELIFKPDIGSFHEEDGRY